MRQHPQLADDSWCEQQQQPAVDDDAERDDDCESSPGRDTDVDEPEARHGDGGGHGDAEANDQRFASHEPRTNTPSVRQVMCVWIGARMKRVMANDAATPTTPQCKPMTNPSTVTGVENRRKRNITPGRPMAWQWPS